MQSVQYLSNDHWYVWITASCLVTSLHANVSLLLRWQQFSFDMQMFWLDEFGSFSVALKPLHYRGRICGMSSSRGFQIQQKSVIGGRCVAGSANEYEWPSLQHSQLSSSAEESGEGLWVCSDSSGLKSLGWHWATQAVFIIDFTGTVGIRCCCVGAIITADPCSFF